MKTRRHHNNKGYRQIKRGKTREQVKALAKKLKIPYNNPMKKFTVVLPLKIEAADANEAAAKFASFLDHFNPIAFTVQVYEGDRQVGNYTPVKLADVPKA